MLKILSISDELKCLCKIYIKHNCAPQIAVSATKKAGIACDSSLNSFVLCKLYMFLCKFTPNKILIICSSVLSGDVLLSP